MLAFSPNPNRVMLSYRHAFHAGNFADVLKHLVLIQILDYLALKDKGICFIDTHAGAGRYALNSGYAQLNREFENGIGRLWQRRDLPAAVSRYLETVKNINGSGQLQHYPGSPLIIRQMMRRQDRLALFELHPTELELLAQNLPKDPRIRIHPEDGLSQATPLLPPIERRGLVLIDPSYEIKTDYQTVVGTLARMHRRFATGTYALWYPVVERPRNQKLEQQLRASGIKNIHLYELALCADRAIPGMTACGMIVVNPPWTLTATLQHTLPWLVGALSENGGFYRIDQIVGE